MIFVVDTLGKDAYYEEIKKSFVNSPFSSNENQNIWRFLESDNQSPGSNDCGIFTLMIFTKYLQQRLTLEDENINKFTKICYNETPKEMGRLGRIDIEKCLKDNKIYFGSPSISSISIL